MLLYISLPNKPWPLVPSSWLAYLDAWIREATRLPAVGLPCSMMLLFNQYFCHVGLEVEDCLADPSPGLRHPAHS